jgi:hypothetical protein
MMELLGHLSLQCVVCLKLWKCVLLLFPFFATAVDSADKTLQMSANPISWQWHYSAHWHLDYRITTQFKAL